MPIFDNNIENKESNTIEIQEDNTIEIEEEEAFFDWDENSDGKIEFVNLNEIEKRKKDLNKFIEIYRKDKNIINMDIEKGKNNNNKKDKEKNVSENNNPKNQCYKVMEIISELKKYKE